MPAVVISISLHAAAVTALPEGVLSSIYNKNGQKSSPLEVNTVMVNDGANEASSFDVIPDAPHVFTSPVLTAKISLIAAHEEARMAKIQKEVSWQEEPPSKADNEKAEQLKTEEPESVDLIEMVRDVENIDIALYRIYKEYYEHVRGRIAECVEYPQSARHLGIAGRVYVQFIVNPGGELEFIDVLKPAAYDVLNYAAVQSIRKAAPFAKYPEKIPRKNFRFSIPIIYAFE